MFDHIRTVPSSRSVLPYLSMTTPRFRVYFIHTREYDIKIQYSPYVVWLFEDINLQNYFLYPAIAQHLYVDHLLMLIFGLEFAAFLFVAKKETNKKVILKFAILGVGKNENAPGGN